MALKRVVDLAPLGRVAGRERQPFNLYVASRHIYIYIYIYVNFDNNRMMIVAIYFSGTYIGRYNIKTILYLKCAIGIKTFNVNIRKRISVVLACYLHLKWIR